MTGSSSSPTASIPKPAANMSGSAAIRRGRERICRRSRPKRPSNCGTTWPRCSCATSATLSRIRRRRQLRLERAARSASKNPKRDRAWAQAALDNECALVGSAAIGDRNRQLNKSAFNLFQIVYGNPGLLSENEVRHRLFAAAEACGLVADDGADAAWRTIESGAAGAETQPRTRPLSIMEQPIPTSDGGNGSATAHPRPGHRQRQCAARSNAGPGSGPGPAAASAARPRSSGI